MAQVLREIGKKAAAKRAKYVGLNNIKKAVTTSPGEFNGIDEYRSSKPKVEHIAIKDRTGKGRKLNKGKPWYYLTKVESITIDRRKPPVNMIHDDYIEGYLNYKMNKWEMKHKEPEKTDLFYKEEYPKWVAAYEEHHDKVMSWVSKKVVKKFEPKIIDMVMSSRNKHSSLKMAA